MKSQINTLAMAAVIGTCCQVQAFAPSPSSRTNAAVQHSTSTSLAFGIPTFQSKNDDDKDGEDAIPKKKMDLKGLAQLITAGMGAPFLGDFQGVDEESGKFMFSLEANNLVDEDGKSKQTSMPYFESGWVDPEDLEKEQKRKEGGFKFPWQS
eukprot:CAMPEP_0198116900 /NCGR_PEP_ID=MMETSP1442-20131203/15278_1 /TAXON_ID= /ORGANISM="Craspedostauros australis, Strain CCMP3328" /LENGTH=151 /DNA_ID=CAMNT_0043774829 /DNA_START=131 /DNA_END=586 /DNA_ORIENTATION=+